jgi:hypothetical protein
MENDAVYVHWGWSTQAQSDIASYGINNINGLSYENVYFYRDKSLNVSLEHTGFTDMEKINKGIKALGYSTKTDKDVLLNYSVEDVDLTEVENVIMANNVNIPYSGITTTSYVYDPETKMYNRFVNDEAHVDYVTKEQYAFKNIITYKLKSTVLDSAGRIELDNIGSGEGYYITNGYAVPITWEKASRKAQTKYYFEDGTIINETHPHRFYNVDQGFWQRLQLWNIGDHAINQDGNKIALVSVERLEENIEMFGIWTDNGTYYANGLLSGAAFCNKELLAEATAEQAIDMMLSADEELLVQLMGLEGVLP